MAIQLGDQFPEAELILGNDLSPIQPSWSPPNVKFIVDDIEQDWVESQTYDYIHCRYMAGSIKDWPRLLKQNFLEGVQGFTAQLFTGLLGWTTEEVESLNAGVRAAARDNTVHALFNVVVVTAQKPGKGAAVRCIALER